MHSTASKYKMSKLRQRNAKVAETNQNNDVSDEYQEENKVNEDALKHREANNEFEERRQRIGKIFMQAYGTGRLLTILFFNK